MTLPALDLATLEAAAKTTIWKLRQWREGGHPMDERMIVAVEFAILSLPIEGTYQLPTKKRT